VIVADDGYGTSQVATVTVNVSNVPLKHEEVTAKRVAVPLFPVFMGG